jgi:hypothetical protein
MDGNVILYGGTAKIRSGSKKRTFRAIGQLPLRQKKTAQRITIELIVEIGLYETKEMVASTNGSKACRADKK